MSLFNNNFDNTNDHIHNIIIIIFYYVLPCRDPNWWKDLDDEAELEVKYPYEKHGLAGKTSNRAKLGVLSHFLQFVDANSQPNGRPEDSYSPQFYFISKFTRIVTPKKNDPHYSEVAKRSVIAV